MPCFMAKLLELARFVSILAFNPNKRSRIKLSEYQNKSVDQLLKDGRETLDDKLKAQKYEKLQDTILTDAPALFLYNPDTFIGFLEK